jgi:hypothetical protein
MPGSWFANHVQHYLQFWEDKSRQKLHFPALRKLPHYVQISAGFLVDKNPTEGRLRDDSQIMVGRGILFTIKE